MVFPRNRQEINKGLILLIYQKFFATFVVTSFQLTWNLLFYPIQSFMTNTPDPTCKTTAAGSGLGQDE
jgi:hypothetical protein